MKRITIKILVLSLFILRGVTAHSQMVVKDANKIKQIEREVAWTEWEGHSPKWFYWTIEFFEKDKYRDKDRRNILQLIPLMLAVRADKSKTDDYKKDVDNWAEQEAFKLADYEIDVAYAMLKKDFVLLRGYLEKAIARAQNARTYPEMLTEITNERDRIEGRIYTLRKSTLTNADRREEYFAEMKQYKQLIELTNQVAHAFEIIKK